MAELSSLLDIGTGITPMYQLIRTVLSEPAELDATKLRLLYANRSEEDIILRRELDALAAEHPNRFEVQYVLENLPEDDTRGASQYFHGRISQSIIAKSLPSPKEPEAAILVCGPEGMVESLCGTTSRRTSKDASPILGGMLYQMGYRRQVVPFLDT